MEKILHPKRRPCNQEKNGRYWCQAKKWFMSEPCEFESRHECRNFKVLCLVLR